VDRGRRVVDVGDGTGGRHGLEVLVVDAVLPDGRGEGAPVVLGGDVDVRLGEHPAHALGGRLPHAVHVLSEELTARVGGVLEAGERLAALDGQAVRRREGVVEHGVEVDVGEVDRFLGPVEDPLPGEVPVEVHLPEADRVGLVVAAFDGRNGPDVGLVRDGRQGPDGHLDGLAEVRGVHRLGDVQRPEVARDVLADVAVGEVVVVRGCGGDLEDLGAQVRVGDLAGDRVGPVHRVLEHDVRVAGLELDLGERLEELAGLDLRLADAGVVDHLVVLLADVDVGERHAVDPLDVVRREEVHVLVLAGEFERDVRDDDAEREGLDADLLVRVLPLGVEEPHDVRVVRVQVHRTRTLAGAQLVGVGERVFEQLHHGDDAGGLVLDPLDRRAVLSDVREQERDAAAALGELQRGVDAPRDRLHVVLDAQEEAGDEFTALLLAGVEEGRGGRLEAARDDLVDQAGGQALVALREREGHHDHAVLVALQVALPVERLQRVRRVVLEGAQERGEPELLRVGAVVEAREELEGVLVQHLRLVVAVLHQVVELLPEVVEEDGVLVDVLEEVLPGRSAVGLELDAPVLSVEVEHRVERVVVEVRVYAGICESRCQNRANPSRTRVTSSAVPSSSKSYRWGTPHFSEMMSPAMQYAVPKLVFPAAMTPRISERLCASLRNLIT